jgi:hypothetical protein
MPIVTEPVMESMEDFVRPVVMDITRQLFEWTGLPKDTTILYPGEGGKVAQPGSTQGKEDEINKFNTTTRFQIEVEEMNTESSSLSTAVYQPENTPVFQDLSLGISMRPVYSPMEMEFTFRYRSKDKNEAERWRNDIRTRMSLLRSERLHDISYSYMPSRAYWVLLKEIYRLRENQGGYGDTFEQYCASHRSNKFSELVTQGGIKAPAEGRWGVAETQGRVIGWFDFEGVPEKGELDNDSSAWVIQFTYKIIYSKPVSVVMEYPLMVHNQMLDSKYRPTKRSYKEEDNQQSRSLSGVLLGSFEQNRTLQNNRPYGICIPSIDEFIATQVVPDTCRVFTALTTIDALAPRRLLDLSDLGQYQMQADLLAFLLVERQWITDPLKSCMSLVVYRNTTMLHRSKYFLDTDYMVTLVDEPNVRDELRVRLAIQKDLTTIGAPGIERMRTHCKASRQIMLFLAPTIELDGCLPPLRDDDYITRADFDKAAAYINKARLAMGNGQSYGFNTVNVLSVVAERIENATR